MDVIALEILGMVLLLAIVYGLTATQGWIEDDGVPISPPVKEKGYFRGNDNDH